MILSRSRYKSLFYLKVWRYLNRHINFKMGILSGLVTGSIVFAINTSFGFWPAFASFFKQLIFNLFMAGFNTRTCEKLSKKIESDWFAIFSASVLPTVQAFIVLFAIHYFGHTPKPLASTLWQAFANLFFFCCLALNYRNILQIENPSFYKISRTFRLKMRLATKKITKMGKDEKLAS